MAAVPPDVIRQALEEVDVELREEGVEIFRRPLHALMKLGMRFPQLNGMGMFPTENPRNALEAVPGMVDDWYRGRYGDRLKVDLSIGYYPIVIRGEPWKARLPLIYGQVRIFSDPDLSYPCKPNELNVLGKIEGLTPQLAASLSDEEHREIGSEFVWALNALSDLSSMVEKGMLEPGLVDFNSAVENLFSRNPHPGQCKWSALQFAEKSMKQRLIGFREKPEFSHNLRVLSVALELHGVKIDDQLLDDVQCQPGVRYEEVGVTRHEALKAVQGSLRIYASLFCPVAFQFSDGTQL